jgi:methylglyoxal synthase
MLSTFTSLYQIVYRRVIKYKKCIASYVHDLCVESSVVEVAKRIIQQKFLLNCGTKCNRILRGRNFAVHDLGTGKIGG